MANIFARLLFGGGGLVLAGAALEMFIGTAQGAVPAAAALAIGIEPALAGPVGLAMLASGYVLRQARQWAHPDEFKDVGRALHGIGLAERVYLGNLYCADLPDENWRNLFPDSAAMWTFFGPCWERPELRAMMLPALQERLQAARS